MNANSKFMVREVAPDLTHVRASVHPSRTDEITLHQQSGEPGNYKVIRLNVTMDRTEAATLTQELVRALLNTREN